MSANVAYKPNGLDSLLLEEEDIRSYEESKGDVGGIADLGPIRERMEKAGRYGDDRVAHVQTGELVVPKPLIDKFPELKASIFEHLREMGVEDPERYMVGDGENSINPETGLPEFGFFSSVVRGLKSVVKSVGKVLKKVAPTLIKVAGTAVLTSILGPAYAPLAAGISSGIGTLVGGGSIKDAAISAALGGATGALAPSIGSTAAFALQGGAEAAIAGGGFGDVLKGAGMGAAGAAAGKIFGPTLKSILPEGIGGETIKDPFRAGIDALSDDIGRTSGFFSDVTSGEMSKAFQTKPPVVEGDFFPEAGYQDVVPQVAPSPVGPTQFASANNILMGSLGEDYLGTNAITDEIIGGSNLSTKPQDIVPVEFSPENMAINYPAAPAEVPVEFSPENMAINYPAAPPPPPQTNNFFDRLKDDPLKTLITGEEKLTTDSPVYQDAYEAKLKEQLALGKDRAIALSQAKAAAERALKNAQPSFFARNPYLLTGAAVAAPFASKLFEAPEMQKPNILPSGFGQQPINPELVANYRLSEGSLNTAPTRTSPISARVAPRRQSETLRRRFPELFAEDGGGVFPRRTGGIMPDEGVPGKDSVRAMVMPGEFIFTTDAVRGASPTGNLNDGINNMYSVMRKLESRGKRMA